MKKLNQLLRLGVLGIVLASSREIVSAQQPPDWQNMDPQQIQQMFQQRIMDSVREQLVVTNDADWSAIEPLIAKVTQGQMASMMGGMGAMRGMMGNRGGGGFASLGQPDPDAEALQQAIDDNLPSGQIKAMLGKYRESRKRKEDELAKNQEQLRQVLTVRQETVLVLMGILK